MQHTLLLFRPSPSLSTTSSAQVILLLSEVLPLASCAPRSLSTSGSGETLRELALSGGVMVCVAEPTFRPRVAVLGLAADRGARCEVLSALGPATPGRGELLRLDIVDKVEAGVLMFFLSKVSSPCVQLYSSGRMGRSKNNEELERVLKASQIDR